MAKLALLFAAALSVAAQAAPAKVNVTLFSESLCPDCQHYITTSWWDLWQTPGVGGTDGIINWGQYIWGNARLAPDGTITCQHGPAECELNILHNCAVALADGPQQWLPFIHCLEEYGPQQKARVSKCATAAKLPLNALNTCWQGPQGKALVLAAAKATPADHTYVPWATANGVNYCDENGCDGGLAAVCKAYAGTPPSACPKAPSLRGDAAAAAAGGARKGTSCPREW